MTQSLVTQKRPTPTIEDYLAIMYVMERDGEEIIAARLAESLEVAPPTVAVTLKRMERDDWIVFAGRKGIHLTENGLKAARSVIRRHMLTEWMLARMLNVSWSRIHAEAHQIEHTISEEIELKMRFNLDDPQLCPHGNPLPGYEYISANWVPLSEIAPGEQVIIHRIHEIAEGNSELMDFLETNGVVPGAQAKVCEVLPFNQTLTLLLYDRRVTLGFSSARYIFVEDPYRIE
jgi:DtxR family transcriptional regulator, Mn-dependent transcriptional regulator